MNCQNDFLFQAENFRFQVSGCNNKTYKITDYHSPARSGHPFMPGFGIQDLNGQQEIAPKK